MGVKCEEIMKIKRSWDLMVKEKTSTGEIPDGCRAYVTRDKKNNNICPHCGTNGSLFTYGHGLDTRSKCGNCLRGDILIGI